VQEARERQERRYRDTEIRSNAQLDGLLLKQYIRLTSAATSLLKESFRKHTLSSRSWSRLLKVARTIADLEGKPKTHDVHLLEAIAYRTQRKENV
ncbi:MAG: magnesium chelatase, partial [Myxococcota bacterium]|nr:magnesium chelatase [Myxococcota bacterium]